MLNPSKTSRSLASLLFLAVIVAAAGCGGGGGNGGGSQVTLQSIQVTPANSSCPLGLTQEFNAKGAFSDGSTQDLTSTATWASSATAVATVSSAGLLTSKSQGSTTIQATSGSVNGSTNWTVGPPALTMGRCRAAARSSLRRRERSRTEASRM